MTIGTPAARPPSGPRPTAYFSTIAGVVVAWDVCGECHQHITLCRCDEGPAEPAFLAAQRSPADPPIATEHPQRIPRQVAADRPTVASQKAS